MRFRIWLTVVGSLMALASVTIIVCVWKWDYRFGLPVSTDKITRINTVVATSAYAAAIIAAIFALIAYWQANGLPSLKPKISFLPFNSADPAFQATLRQPPPWVDVNSLPLRDENSPPGDPDIPVLLLDRVGSDTILMVVLENKTKYAARNPGLRIEFFGLLFNGPPPEWTPVERWGEKNGLKAIQWDGGTDNIVHGKWSRALPIVGFNEIVVHGPMPSLKVTVVADGCRPKEFNFPLNVRRPW